MPTEQRLRIALVAPPWYPIPPSAYGGIEALVYWLAEGLLARGHQVTVIGAGQPRTRARFATTYQEAPTERLGEVLPELLHAAHAARLLDELEVQVVHDHSAAGPLAATRTLGADAADRPWAGRRRARRLLPAAGPATGGHLRLPTPPEPTRLALGRPRP